VVPLDVRQLECFIAVAEERHVGRAATRLHMTQPPLTRRITRLERELGAILFRRSPTGVEPTAAGEVLLERAYRILQLAEHAVERTKLAGVGLGGALMVGYTGPTVLDVVPTLLRAFLDDHPGISLTLEAATKDEQIEAIRDGRMHLGFGARYPGERDMVTREVLRDPLMAALPRDHRLLAREQVELDDLRHEQLALFPAAPRPSFTDEVIGLFAGAGYVIRPARIVGHLVDALAYVSTTGLCAVVPKSATRIAMPDVTYVPLAGDCALSLDCVHRAEDTPALVEEFLRHLDRSTEPSVPIAPVALPG
jgi:DNA-binding transcriptional LysR family regulator